MKGRKPKPTRLRLITGNASKRPINERQATPGLGLPRPPAHFRDASELARISLREYRRMGRALVSLGLMTAVDGPMLALYADAYARWVVASRGLQDHGLLVKGARKGEPVRSPYQSIASRAFDQMRAILLEFGVGPSARGRVDAIPPVRVDPFQNFLNGYKD